MSSQVPPEPKKEATTGTEQRAQWEAHAADANNDECLYCCSKPMVDKAFLYGCSARGVRHYGCKTCLLGWISRSPRCGFCRAPSALVLDVSKVKNARAAHDELPWHLASYVAIPQTFKSGSIFYDKKQEEEHVEALEDLENQLTLVEDETYLPRSGVIDLLDIDDEYEEDDDDDFSTVDGDEAEKDYPWRDDESSYSCSEDEDSGEIAFSLRTEDKRKRRTFDEGNYERYTKRSSKDDDESYTEEAPARKKKRKRPSKKSKPKSTKQPPKKKKKSAAAAATASSSSPSPKRKRRRR